MSNLSLNSAPLPPMSTAPIGGRLGDFRNLKKLVETSLKAWGTFIPKYSGGDINQPHYVTSAGAYLYGVGGLTESILSKSEAGLTLGDFQILKQQYFALLAYEAAYSMGLNIADPAVWQACDVWMSEQRVFAICVQSGTYADVMVRKRDFDMFWGVAGDPWDQERMANDIKSLANYIMQNPEKGFFSTDFTPASYFNAPANSNDFGLASIDSLNDTGSSEDGNEAGNQDDNRFDQKSKMAKFDISMASQLEASVTDHTIGYKNSPGWNEQTLSCVLPAAEINPESSAYINTQTILLAQAQAAILSDSACETFVPHLNEDEKAPTLVSSYSN